MASTLNAVAVVCITWSVPLGLSASALIYSTAAMGRKRASTRCRVRAALSIDFSSRDEAAGRPGALMLNGGAQLGWYLRKGSVAGASEELPVGHVCLLFLSAACRRFRCDGVDPGGVWDGEGDVGAERRGGAERSAQGSGQCFLDGADAGGGCEGVGLTGLQQRTGALGSRQDAPLQRREKLRPLCV